MTRGTLQRRLTTALVYLGIVVVTLLVIDGACILFNLFPPSHNYGDPDLGWRPAGATGRMEIGRCTEFSTGETVTYQRNEDGIRTTLSRNAIASGSRKVRIAVVGDSHTDLCATNEQTHAGVLESELGSSGLPASVLAYGAGKYSPLQAYLAFMKVLRSYQPRVMVMNVYTGNDLYDILRVDDRPHMISTDTGYRIAAPVWFQLDDPTVRRRSRVLFAVRAVANKIGVRQTFRRISELRRLSGQYGGGLPEVVGYMGDLWKGREASVGYSDAFTAQMLNQQLFFQRFPSSQVESLRRLQALMVLVRAENPGLLLVMSPLPSYQLVGEQPVDSALLRTLRRLPITYQEGVVQERFLYERLRGLSAQQGWLFVDNLEALRLHRGNARLYNTFDYHLTPTASAIVGRTQADALIDTLRRFESGRAPLR